MKVLEDKDTELTRKYILKDLPYVVDLTDYSPRKLDRFFKWLRTNIEFDNYLIQTPKKWRQPYGGGKPKIISRHVIVYLKSKEDAVTIKMGWSQ